MGRKSAFTLIELLVVIAIIAILASIIFPVFAQAKEAAKKTTCLSNEKQFGVSVVLYANDYNEQLPQIYPVLAVLPWVSHEVGPVPYEDPAGDIFFLLSPYTKSAQGTSINRCLSDPVKDPAVHPNSYIPNGFFCFGANSTSVVNPARTIYLTESGDANQDRSSHPWMITRLDGTLDQDHLDELREDIASARHLGGSNYLFIDSHAKWLNFESTYAPVNMFDPRAK